MKMNLDVVKDLAKSLNKNNLKEIVIETDGVKLTMKKEIPVEPVIQHVQHVAQNVVHAAPQATVATPEEVKVAEPVGETINSPMVGTFYSKPGPGKEAFVKEGQRVKAGETICIVEAMKLMNEVKAQKDCTIEKILVADGGPLKKGDAIFIIS